MQLAGTAAAERAIFATWWERLVMAVVPEKDVDGLTGKATVVPATGVAVLKIMAEWKLTGAERALIIGRSDLLGVPLAKKMREEGWQVELVGKKELAALKERPERLTGYQLIVSATGVANLIRGEDIAPGVYLIDVGEPRGDVELESAAAKARAITPVPGGVGPVTAICLMENCWWLSQR
jgi:methylenetetrahydrofolate dehydrogenase (NADP+)/methenyltetrahydrofolate cyclohydrolase